jgi:hypothetical protein
MDSVAHQEAEKYGEHKRNKDFCHWDASHCSDTLSPTPSAAY